MELDLFGAKGMTKVEILANLYRLQLCAAIARPREERMQLSDWIEESDAVMCVH